MGDGAHPRHPHRPPDGPLPLRAGLLPRLRVPLRERPAPRLRRHRDHRLRDQSLGSGVRRDARGIHRHRDQRGGRRGVDRSRTPGDEPLLPADKPTDRPQHRGPVRRPVPVRERPRLVRELVEVGGARRDLRRLSGDRLPAREGVPDLLGRHAARVDVLLRGLRDPRGAAADRAGGATRVRVARSRGRQGARLVSDITATVRGRVTDIPASLLAPPEKPWWSWLTSDRAARYTARLTFLAVWQWAGTTFEDIPAPTGTIEFLVEEFQRGAVFPNVAISLLRAVI